MPNVSVQGRDASQDHNHTYILCFSFEGKIPKQKYCSYGDICVMCDLCYWLAFLDTPTFHFMLYLYITL